MGKNQNRSRPNEEMEKDMNSVKLKAETEKQTKKDLEEITC